MKLFYSDASPYARCVRVCIQYYQITEIEEVIVNPFENHDELLKCNPLAKVPCLALNDGSSLYDSEIIMKYIDAECGTNALFGGQHDNWAEQCHFSLLKGILDSAVSLRVEQLREAEGLRSNFWTGRYEQALLRGLKQVVVLGITHYEKLTAQQVMLVCILDYLDFRHPQLSWRDLAPTLGQWLASAGDAPAFLASRPHG
ncbi:glutathione S-transferase N-terminal domain-containing protein [Shewanella sp. 125m-7]